MSGELSFEDTFRIDGHFKGKIDADGDLIVGDGGDVEAEITARCVYFSGTVRGSIRAKERLEITAFGKVYADLGTPSLSIEDGAFFEGRCSMEQPAAKVAQKVTKMPLTAG